MKLIPITIDAAIENYLTSSGVIDSADQAELRRFERWIGKTKLLSNIGPLDIEHYGERFSASDPECSRKLEIVRKFLTFSRDKSWSKANLAVHLKVKKTKSRATGITRTVRPELTVLTRQGYDDIVVELSKLKAQRPHVLEEIRRAAADKDFRENAPLHAAREQLGHIDGRVQELSAIIKAANIIGENDKQLDRVAAGNTIMLIDLKTMHSIAYTIVGPKEANPAEGKISYISPIGKAVIGKSRGDIVEVITPAGNRQYRIETVKQK